MLSAGMQHQSGRSGYGHLGNGDMMLQHDRNAQSSSQRQHLTGLDALAQGSQYALQQLHNDAMSSSKRPQESYSAMDHVRAQQDQGIAQGHGKPASGPPRRRISRACDQCNQLRTKCDGKSPCAHCVEFGLTCEYNRAKKKRGKASRKDLARQTTGDANHESPGSATEQTPESHQTPEQPVQMGSLKRRRSSDHHTVPADLAQQHTQLQSLGASRMTHDLESVPARDQYGTMPVSMTTQSHMTALPHARLPSATMSDRSNAMGITEFSGSIGDYHRNLLHDSTSANGQSVLHSGLNGLQNHMTTGLGYGDSPYNIGASPHSQSGLNAFRISGSPTAGHPNFLGASPTARSPGWFQLPSPSAALYTGLNITSNSQNLRYPVLRPILSRISAIIPISLACDLLELYFESSYSTFIQPASPYVLGFVFRKRSFLRQNNPRPCNPALLASMLWVGAQTSESSFLTSPPSSRGRVCQQLLELTISLLKPLIHTPAESVPSQSTYPVINGVALGGFGVALHAARHDSESGSMGAAGALDDVATYINLASVVSASEYKGASLRWWNAAWSLARELKLGRELPPNPEPPVHADEDTLRGTNPDVDVAMGSRPGLRTQQRTIHKRADAPGTVSEEEREERRRIWWFLYIVDRHLALCYNRPLFLLDAECDSLLQPEDDVIFQSGEYYPSENQQENYFRRRGPSFECTGHSIFGYFLPLMTILGEIVDLNHARNHPRFGVRLRTSPDLDDMQNEICLQLGAYERSLEAFEARYIPADNAHSTHKQQAAAAAKGSAGTGTAGSVADDDKPSPSNQSTCTATGGRITEPILLTKIIVAYGTHLMHTLHILLNGKWDPISLLDDNDLWISSQSFISATSHAVSAAEAISAILDYDPDLSFMPFFFGIYLLQGSFLLLLIADKLQGEASPAVVGACENIVRAHEVCVVTLNTEYQRNFRKVMRSALQQVRGRTLEDTGEQQLRRREVLALYRWTGDGTGLAL